MLSKIPISASSLSLPRLIGCAASVFSEDSEIQFKKALGDYYKAEHVFLLNSGLACLYLILESLRTRDKQGRNQVIIPAYTAGSLVVAIKKAGLVPVLCDISPVDFNLDIDFLIKIISDKTLCLVAVHMFGIPTSRINELKDKFPGIIIIEDVCQAMGGSLDSRPLGNMGDIGFFSFNRGKNVSAYGGGCIITNNSELAVAIESRIEKLKKPLKKEVIKTFFKLLLLSVILNRLGYGLVYGLIARFKENAPPQDVVLEKFTGLQSAVALKMFKDIKFWSEKRYNNGTRIIQALSDMQQLMLPKVEENAYAAFNRLPIVFRDLKKRQRVELALEKAGIETSRMYLRPLHHMFDLGYAWGKFPNAVFLGGHLLTLPVHPLMADKDIKTLIKIIKQA